MGDNEPPKSNQHSFKLCIAEDIVKYRGQLMNSAFDPGIAEIRVKDSIDSIEIGMADFGGNIYKLFDEMPNGGITRMGRGYLNFDPGGLDSSKFYPEIAEICARIASASFMCCYLDVVADGHVSFPYGGSFHKGHVC